MILQLHVVFRLVSSIRKVRFLKATTECPKSTETLSSVDVDQTDNAPSIYSASQLSIKPRQRESALLKALERVSNQIQQISESADITDWRRPNPLDHDNRVEPLQLDPCRQSYVERQKGGGIRKVRFLKATTECPKSTETLSSVDVDQTDNAPSIYSASQLSIKPRQRESALLKGIDSLVSSQVHVNKRRSVYIYGTTFATNVTTAYKEKKCFGCRGLVHRNSAWLRQLSYLGARGFKTVWNFMKSAPLRIASMDKTAVCGFQVIQHRCVSLTRRNIS
ncbi:hypothetical protein CLF_103910 [Clonorchis sinensis]|uniref:Uncharacterized protein n=1 Tax=Clonorchis sinensis TaxID=79923 RepID=G7YAL8_CLOSI|nr:hypothetical protein CLF_103910 [Clonorchis sinensis]